MLWALIIQYFLPVSVTTPFIEAVDINGEKSAGGPRYFVEECSQPHNKLVNKIDGLKQF